MKNRCFKELKIILSVFLAGLFYLWIAKFHSIRIPCLFHEITGLLCPSCGISRMFIAISDFDFSSAFHFNPVLFSTLPYCVFLFFSYSYLYIKTGKQTARILNILTWIEIVILVIYGVIRNIG